MHGLRFLGQGIANYNRGRWDHDKALEKQKRLKAHQWVVHHKQELSEHEQKVIDEIERQLKDPNPRVSRKICPECHDPFTRIQLPGVELDSCRKCHGCWFDPHELQMFTGLRKEIPGDQLQSRVSKYKCPVCGVKMTEYVFLKPYNLLVDRCPKGHGVYLEDRELERVFKMI